MYFHTDSRRTVAWLANVLAQAEANERSVRFAVGGDGSLKVKVGEGMWTHPIEGTPDPQRDWTPCHDGCTPTVCHWLERFKANAEKHCGHDECHQHQRCVYV